MNVKVCFLKVCVACLQLMEHLQVPYPTPAPGPIRFSIQYLSHAAIHITCFISSTGHVGTGLLFTESIAEKFHKQR
jgi:hypothetical protein